MPIDHIVFDIGKVLIHYDPNIPFSRLIPDEAERKWFFENVCTHDWNVEQDRGRTWEEAEAIRIARSISGPSANTGTRWSPSPTTTASPSWKA
jgi:FMN phosphatase YigB (HAD superfamily)